MKRPHSGRHIDPPFELPPGVRLVRGRLIPWIGGLLAGGPVRSPAGTLRVRPAAAVTLGSTIIVSESAAVTPELVRHELEHVRQWRDDGWLFPFRYMIRYARYGYRANPYEVAARAAEHEPSRSPPV